MPSQEIQVKMRPEITYVAGTVNGSPTVFTHIGGDVWRTTVPRSLDNVYHIYVIAYNEFGIAAEIERTMSLGWINGITSRTFENPLYRNAVDLNRIGSNMKFLAKALKDYGYFIFITPKDDWIGTEMVVSHNDIDYADIPREEDIQKILDEIDSLRSVYYVFPTTPDTPSVPVTIWWKMNDIEQILEDMHLLFRNMEREFIFSGEISCGEDDFN